MQPPENVVKLRHIYLVKAVFQNNITLYCFVCTELIAPIEIPPKMHFKNDFKQQNFTT